MKNKCQHCVHLEYIGRTDFQCNGASGGRRIAYCKHPNASNKSPNRNAFIGYLNDNHPKQRNYKKLTPSCKSWCPLKIEVKNE